MNAGRLPLFCDTALAERRVILYTTGCADTCGRPVMADVNAAVPG